MYFYIYFCCRSSKSKCYKGNVKAFIFAKIQFPWLDIYSANFLDNFPNKANLKKIWNIYFYVSDINYVARTFSDNWILMGDPSWNGRKDVNIYSETGNSPWKLKVMKWQGFALLAILVSEGLQGAGIGWMKVDSNGRATPAEHQVKTNKNTIKVLSKGSDQFYSGESNFEFYSLFKSSEVLKSHVLKCSDSLIGFSRPTERVGWRWILK